METKMNLFGIKEIKEIIKSKRTLYLLMMIFVYFSYLLGIIQDIFYGIFYFINLIKGINKGTFPFMIGWGIIMIWGLINPIQRKGILLCTSILVIFMFIEELIISMNNNNLEIPFIRIIGILLWLITFLFCGFIEKKITIPIKNGK